MQLTVQEAEEKSRLYKRSVYVVRDIETGEMLTNENVRVIRPGHGLEPKYYSNVIGKTAEFSLKRGTPLELNHLC